MLFCGALWCLRQLTFRLQPVSKFVAVSCAAGKIEFVSATRDLFVTGLLRQAGTPDVAIVSAVAAEPATVMVSGYRANSRYEKSRGDLENSFRRGNPARILENGYRCCPGQVCQPPPRDLPSSST